MKVGIQNRTILFLILLASSLSWGQGTLRGVVSDSLTNNTLIGANVFLLGTALGSATDIEGKYLIPNIPEGNYTLRVSYIGYKVTEINISVVAGRATELNITIIPDVLEGEEVIVTGQVSGQISAINQQRSSNTIINVISEEKIKELPDANATESVGRLPGVSILRSGGEANKVILRGLDAKFVNITIDGVKIPPTDATSRGVDLSMISQSSLAGIELYKALTPDKDGDALAGSVNLVTKKAPEKRTLRTSLKGSYNDLMESADQYDYSIHYGERFFNSVLGVQLTGNLENRIRSNERINVDHNQNALNRYYFIDDFLLEFTDEIRKREGLSLLLDIETPDDGVIKINSVYGNTNRDYLWSTRDYPIVGGGSQNGSTVYNYRDREQDIRTFNSSIRGDNEILGLSLNWGLSFAQSESEYPYDYELIFVEPNGMLPGAPQLQNNPELLIPYAVNNFRNTDLQWAYYRSQDNFDKEKTAFLDIAKSYIIGDLISGELKLGGKYKIKNRSNRRTEDFTPYYLGRWFTYEKLPDGTLQPKDFTGTYFEEWWRNGGGTAFIADFLDSPSDLRNVYDSYLLNPLISRDKLRQWWELNKYGVDPTGNQFEVWNNPLIKFDDYDITERVSAGYLMNTLNIGQDLTIIAGLRMEYEDNDYLAGYMTTRAQGFPVRAVFKDTMSFSQQTVWLPNLNLSFRPFEFMNLRVAVYKALSRPDFNMRMERIIAGRPAESTSSFIVYVGNPNLKTAQAWNFEVNTSFFGNEFGLISFSAYYKEIKDMYHMMNGFTTEAVRDNQGVLQDTLMQQFGINWPNLMGSTPYELTLPYNSPDPTKVWGFEFEHQINFHFLPGLLKNIVLSYNASIVRSETIIYGSQNISYIDSVPIPHIEFTNILIKKKQKLEGMPEFFGNISLGYDIAGFSARVSLFHKGDHNLTFSADGQTDQITNAFTRLDLALKQKITDYLFVFVNINNITNVEDGSSSLNRVYNRELFDQSEKYGLTADFGVNLEL